MIGARGLAAAVLLVVFAAGGVAGVFFERHHSARPARAQSVEEIHEATMAELKDALDLNEAQVEQIHAILTRRQKLVQDKWEQLRPEVQSAMRDVHSEIADVLNPSQVALFHNWLRQFHGSHSPIPIQIQQR